MEAFELYKFVRDNHLNTEINHFNYDEIYNEVLNYLNFDHSETFFDYNIVIETKKNEELDIMVEIINDEIEKIIIGGNESININRNVKRKRESMRNINNILMRENIKYDHFTKMKSLNYIDNKNCLKYFKLTSLNNRISKEMSERRKVFTDDRFEYINYLANKDYKINAMKTEIQKMKEEIKLLKEDKIHKEEYKFIYELKEELQMKIQEAINKDKIITNLILKIENELNN